MKLDDPELLRKDAQLDWNRAGFFGTREYKSLYCRNNHHHRCKFASCQCDCHTEASKQLAHHLMAEKGAVRVDALGFRKCYSSDCENRVDAENDLFCSECNKGQTPGVRKSKMSAEQEQALLDKIESHMTRPL